MTISNIVRYEIKNFTSSKLAMIGFIVGTIINLFAFYFTSKAFVPKSEIITFLGQSNYFEYIVIGEISLILTSLFFNDSQELYERLKNFGILEKYWLSDKRTEINTLKHYLALSIIKLIIILVNLFLIIILFSFKVSLLNVFLFLLVQIAILILFTPIFLLFFYFAFALGKKSSLFLHAISFLSVLSGAYFPLEVFGGEYIVSLLKINPISLQISLARTILNSNYSEVPILLLRCLGWTLVSCLFLYFLRKFVYKWKMKNII